MTPPAYQNVLLLGAGHGHLDLIKHLDELTGAGVTVTVVSPEPVGLYSGMIPGLMGTRYSRAEVSLPVREIVETRGGVFVEDRVHSIDQASRRVTLASGRTLGYEVLSVALGSVIASDRLPRFEGSPEEGVFPIKPFANVEAARDRVTASLQSSDTRAVVVGGGPAAVEIAGNLARLGRESLEAGAPGRLEVALVCGGAPLARFPAGCRRKALRALERSGVYLCRGPRAEHVEPGAIFLQDGYREPADIVILAPGVKPPPVLAASDLPSAPDGALPIDATMRVHTEAPVFAAGDSSHLTHNPLARIGAHALRGGKALRKNLIQLVLTGAIARPARYNPKRGVFLALNVGDGRAAACFHGASLFGRWVFLVKELIDTAFVRGTVRSVGKRGSGRKYDHSVVAG
jgi:NADH dehydrogenase FAD-containing subunit